MQPCIASELLAQQVLGALVSNRASGTFQISGFDYHRLRENVEELLPTTSPETIRQVTAIVSESLGRGIHRTMRTIQNKSSRVHPNDVRYDLLEWLRSDVTNPLSPSEIREALEVCVGFLKTWQPTSDAEAIDVNSSVAEVYLSVFEGRLGDSDRVRWCMLLATADRVVWDMSLQTTILTGSQASTMDESITRA